MTRTFGIADQFSITLTDAGLIDVLFSPGMAGHVRDSAFHLADDPAAEDTWDEPTRGLLVELGEALSDALGMLPPQRVPVANGTNEPTRPSRIRT